MKENEQKVSCVLLNWTYVLFYCILKIIFMYFLGFRWTRIVNHYPNKIYYSYFNYILTSEYNHIYEIYGSISNFKSFSLRRKIAYEICVQEGYQNLTRISSKIYENSFLIWQGKLLQICNGSYLTVKMFPIDKSLNFCQHNALNNLNHLWLLNLFITYLFLSMPSRLLSLFKLPHYYFKCSK